MVIPTSYSSAIVLLLLGCVCFSLYLNLYKALSARWRYELFSLDFALGAMLLSLLATYTLGLLGPEISFSDRMLIAGNAASAWVIGAGFVFTLGNMLLLAAIRLLGLALALLISFGSALVVIAGWQLGRTNAGFIEAGIVLTLAAVVLGGYAAKRRYAPATPAIKPGMRAFGTPPKPPSYKKCVVVAIGSGLALGSLAPVLKVTSDAQFGPGAYASVLLLSIGLLLATPLLNLFLMNIKIVGNSIRFNAYQTGTRRLHLLGIGGGALWAAGTVAVLLAFAAIAEQAAGKAPILVLPMAAGVVCAVLGLTRWREFDSNVSSVKKWVVGATFGFGIGLLLVGLGVT